MYQNKSFFKKCEYLLENYFKKNMSYNKNVVEDALFQIKNLEETLQENAKGILQSTMSEEIKQLVKESLREQAQEVEEPEAEDDMEMDTETEMEPADDEMEMDTDMEDDDMEGDDMEMDADMEMDDQEMDMDDDEAIDMTDASDEEVLRVFKAMGDDDGIVVKKEGGYLHVTDDDDDYLIQLGEQYDDSEADLDEMYDMDFEEADLDEMYDMDFEEDEEYEEEDEDLPMRRRGKFDQEETIYEIMMDDSDGESDEEYYGDSDLEEQVSQYAMTAASDITEYSDSDLDEEMAMKEPMESYYDMDEEMEYSDETSMVDSVMEAVKKSLKKSVKPKGVGIGRGPKFGYDKKPNMSGGFSEKKKEAFGKGIKAMGTGKARFEYKEGENMEKGSMKKVETKEASRTYGNGSKNNSRGLRKGRMNNRNYEYNPFKLSESRTDNQVQLLKEKNEEYKQALDVFRTKLNEVAVFNSNLAYATRLFTEHSTTKQEKINILRRFDNVETLKESKNLYKTIKDELSSNGSVGEQKINESIDRAVNRTVETGSSVNLIESKTYENPQFLRMKDLMTKLK